MHSESLPLFGYGRSNYGSFDQADVGPGEKEFSPTGERAWDIDVHEAAGSRASSDGGINESFSDIECGKKLLDSTNKSCPPYRDLQKIKEFRRSASYRAIVADLTKTLSFYAKSGQVSDENFRAIMVDLLSLVQRAMEWEITMCQKDAYRAPIKNICYWMVYEGMADALQGVPPEDVDSVEKMFNSYRAFSELPGVVDIFADADAQTKSIADYLTKTIMTIARSGELKVFSDLEKVFYVAKATLKKFKSEILKTCFADGHFNVGEENIVATLSILNELQEFQTYIKIKREHLRTRLAKGESRNVDLSSQRFNQINRVIDKLTKIFRFLSHIERKRNLERAESQLNGSLLFACRPATCASYGNCTTWSVVTVYNFLGFLWMGVITFVLIFPIMLRNHGLYECNLRADEHINSLDWHQRCQDDYDSDISKLLSLYWDYSGYLSTIGLLPEGIVLFVTLMSLAIKHCCIRTPDFMQAWADRQQLPQIKSDLDVNKSSYRFLKDDFEKAMGLKP